ncbi:hypothetical protein LPN04_27595 [Rugamonas sp. A1-17]|nr:hypothetical protein [Rugamonas sp. A1-17]
MNWTKKYDKSYFGYKLHACVDKCYKLLREMAVKHSGTFEATSALDTNIVFFSGGYMKVETSYAGFCIYCGGKASSDEHFISRWLGGVAYIKKASCVICQKIINDDIENPLSRGLFWSARKFLGLKSTSDSKEPLPLILINSGKEEEVLVPLDCNPGFLTMPALPEPSIFLHTTPMLRTGEITWQFITSIFDQEKHDKFKKLYPSDYVATRELGIVSFMRLLAKMAHGYAVHSGIPFRPLLRDFILYGDRAKGEFFVGGLPGFGPRSDHSMVYAADWISINGVEYLEIQFQLFPLAGMPVYRIIVGEALDFIDYDIFKTIWTIKEEATEEATRKEGYLNRMYFEWRDTEDQSLNVT